MNAWRAWSFDGPTVAWTVWIVYFLVLEAWAVVTTQPQHTLTHHLRPLFTEHPLTWFLALGLWLWIGVHFLAPPVERWIVDAVSVWGGR